MIDLDEYANKITLEKMISTQVGKVQGRDITSFMLSATLSDQVTLVSALAWLFAVLQSSGQDGLASSGVVLRNIGHAMTQRYALGVGPLQPARASNPPGNSFLPSVPRAASAVDFPTPARNLDLAGLELSFELTCYLCRPEYEVIEHGGIVLFGSHSLVYPVKMMFPSLTGQKLPSRSRLECGRAT
jgi:hypothetical protein